MAVYQYKCAPCDLTVEVSYHIADSHPTPVCESCRALTRKVYGIPGIAFKGSGFYSTDNRK